MTSESGKPRFPSPFVGLLAAPLVVRAQDSQRFDDATIVGR